MSDAIAEATEAEQYAFLPEELPLWIWMTPPEGDGGIWYRVPSWRVTFVSPVMDGIDARVHKSLRPDQNGWLLAEATTGMVIESGSGDESIEDVISLFITGRLPTLTAEKFAAALAKGAEWIRALPPRPTAT